MQKVEGKAARSDVSVTRSDVTLKSNYLLSQINKTKKTNVCIPVSRRSPIFPARPVRNNATLPIPQSPSCALNLFTFGPSPSAPPDIYHLRATGPGEEGCACVRVRVRLEVSLQYKQQCTGSC